MSKLYTETWSYTFCEWLRTDSIFTILNKQNDDDYAFTDWSAGGCYLLAKAIQACIPNTNLAIIGTQHLPVNHVVAQVNQTYIDGDGLFSKDEMLTAQGIENQCECTLNEFDEVLLDAWEIICPTIKLDLLIPKLQSFLKIHPFPGSLSDPT